MVDSTHHLPSIYVLPTMIGKNSHNDSVARIFKNEPSKLRQGPLV